MDIKGSDPSEKKGTEANDGRAVIGIGCVILVWAIYAVIIVGSIIAWIVEDGRTTLYNAWEWISYNKIRRVSFVISVITCGMGFFAGLEMFFKDKIGFVRFLVSVLKALAFALLVSIVCFFVLYGVLEIGDRILKWINKGE